MRRLIAFACSLSIAFAGMALATQTRVLTMGESNTVLKDEANLAMWPQTLSMYPDRGLADISGGAVTTTAAHNTFGDFVLGAYWTKEQWPDDYLPVYFDPDGDGIKGLDQKMSLYYARDLGGLPFGFSFSLFGNSHEKKGTSKTFHSGLGLKIGAGLTLMETLETGLELGTLSWEEKDNAGKTIGENEGGTSIEFNARWWKEMSDVTTIVPHFSFATMSGGLKPTPGAATKDDATRFQLGLGANLQVNEKVLIVHDIGITMMSRTVDDGTTKHEYAATMLPYFRGGMEAPLSEHFTFRLGGVKEWNSNSHKVGSDEEITGTVRTQFYIGAGYVRGNFTLDANLDPGFFTRGPYLITGADGDWATQVSLKYVWGS